MIETFDSINQWQRETFPDATGEGVLDHLKEEWAEFLAEVENPGQPAQFACYEAADLIILLCAYIERNGHSPQSLVDDKMIINRGRMWQILSDGTGRHL